MRARSGFSIDTLRARWLGTDSRSGLGMSRPDLRHVHPTGTGGYFIRGKVGRYVKLTTYVRIALRCRTRSALPPLYKKAYVTMERCLGTGQL